jgi:hypothetical protein
VISAILLGFAVDSDSLRRASHERRAVEDATRQSENGPDHFRQTNELSSISFAPTASGEKVFALQADNILLRFSGSGASPAELPLASPPLSQEIFGAHLIATNLDQSILFILIRGDAQSHSSVAVVDTVEMKLLRTYPLPGGMEFQGIAVGARTGHIYLSGNQIRGSPVPRSVPFNSHSYIGDPVVWVLDPGDGTVIHRWRPNLPEENDWLVYQAEPSEDEGQILVSYHGSNTTGIDSFDVREDELLRCKSRQTPRFGCTYAHGAFIQVRDRLFTATGRPGILEHKSGRVDRVFDTELEGNHLMEFTIDHGQGRIYAIGSCGNAGGLSVLELNGGGQDAKMNADGWSWQVVGNPAPRPQILIKNREVCGERIAVESGSLIVVAQTHGPGSLDIPGALLFLDGGTGQLISRFISRSHPVDVAIIHVGLP